MGKFIEDEYPKFDKRDLEILARENITDEPHVYHIEEHFYLNGSSAKTHRLHRRGEANQLDHILTYTGRLEWSRQISPEDDRPVYRDDENTDSPSESAPQSINDCTNEWLKDPKDMKPGQIDIDDEDTDPNCNYC